MNTGQKRDRLLESPGFHHPAENFQDPPHSEPADPSGRLFPEPHIGLKLKCDEIDEEMVDLEDPVNDDLMTSGVFFEVVDGTPDPKKPIPNSSQFGYEMTSLSLIDPPQPSSLPMATGHQSAATGLSDSTAHLSSPRPVTARALIRSSH